VAEGGQTRVLGQWSGLARSPWRGIIRAGDGDLWLQSADASRVSSAGESARLAVETLRLQHPGLAAGSIVTVSVGLACMEPDELPSISALIGGADSAPYSAKREGRNRIVLFRPEIGMAESVALDLRRVSSAQLETYALAHGREADRFK